MKPARGRGGRRSATRTRRLPGAGAGAGAAAGGLVALGVGLSILTGALGATSSDTPAPAGADPGDRAAVLAPPTDFSAPEPDEELPGGAATSRHAATRNAFSHPSATLTFAQQLDFRVGDGIFRKLWVSAPASTTSSDGLGPLYNARSCQSCHLKDGRGHPAEGRWPDGDGTSMLFRVSVPLATDAERLAIEDGRQAVVPEPTYGTQLQGFAIQGHSPEARVRITYEDQPVTLHGGAVVHLQKPTYRVEDLGYGPIRPDVLLSPRVAAPMIGLGLLEMVDEADILARADPDDRDGDGISGRPNRVWSMEHGRPMLGRFGWKAARATIRDQTAGAFSGDMGLSTELLPAAAGDCTEAQAFCRGAPSGADPPHGVEVAPTMFDLVVFYARNLAVPMRRQVDAPEVLRGKQVFYQAGCAACHTPKYVTRADPERRELSQQLIWPYTDLLLHDMGPGLADGRSEGRASVQEWRTPPLWGVGFTAAVSGHTRFLHDGRARSLLEAILWHGGEAEAARQRVVRMTRGERDALLAFLASL
jgi:CxxC motif-containing protein (DUF1111 family)